MSLIPDLRCIFTEGDHHRYFTISEVLEYFVTGSFRRVLAGIGGCLQNTLKTPDILRRVQRQFAILIQEPAAKTPEPHQNLQCQILREAAFYGRPGQGG